MNVMLLLLLAAVNAPAAVLPDVRLLGAQLGQCAVDRRPVVAAEYVLDIETDSAEARKLHRELPLAACLSKLVGTNAYQLRLPADTLRYALANALFRKELALAPPSDFSAVSPLRRATLNEEHFRPKPGKKASARELAELGAMRSDNIAAIRLAVFGECVVRTATQDSHALLSTAVGSTEESARFETLSRAYRGCLPAGLTSSLDRSAVRGAVALSYYRLAKASRASPTRGPNR